MELQGNFRTTVRHTILLPFVDETIRTLEVMADLKGASDLLTYRDPLDVFNFKNFAVCIVAKNANGVVGKVIMNYDQDTALAIGNRVLAKMLGPTEAATGLTEDIRGALAEFSNTVIGLATRQLGEKNIKITFGTPVYLLNKDDGDYLLEGVKQILTVPIDIDGTGRFYFSYLMHNEV
jgi:CheY-specific phosphatase CheX